MLTQPENSKWNKGPVKILHKKGHISEFLNCNVAKNTKEVAERVMGQMVKGVESCQNSTSIAHNLLS